MSSAEIPKFSIERYVSEGSRVDDASVTKIVLSEINVSNIKPARIGTDSFSRDYRCKVHSGCKGHITLGSTGYYGLPSFCVNDDAFVIDDRGRVNKALIWGGASPYECAHNLRKTLMGKNGLLRFEGGGMRPLTSVRGVATCNWDIEPDRVLLPSKWMKNMKVPCLRNAGGYVSPYWSFRSAVDEDHTILLRCPSIFETSVMGVTVKSWDEASIGVHPSM
ncbi:hypothetical protein BX666DRAFT_2055555 [Dichotomocladium elegans]|nr:hypothetical protein BX666DRAFT_2055555 [Dichotomocladium elegans]